MNKVICRNEKWSIAIGDQDDIIISISNYPIHIPYISLFDCSIEEFKKLGEMFIAHSIKLSEVESK